jgi:hypothetical protein
VIESTETIGRAGEDAVFMTWVWIYAAGWGLASVLVLAFARQMGDRTRSATEMLLIGGLAGAVWPVLLLGLVQLGALMAHSKRYARRAAADLEDPAGDDVFNLRYSRLRSVSLDGCTRLGSPGIFG